MIVGKRLKLVVESEELDCLHWWPKATHLQPQWQEYYCKNIKNFLTCLRVFYYPKIHKVEVYQVTLAIKPIGTSNNDLLQLDSQKSS